MREELSPGNSLPMAFPRPPHPLTPGCGHYILLLPLWPVPKSASKEFRAWLSAHPKVLYPHRGFMGATCPFRVGTSHVACCVIIIQYSKVHMLSGALEDF